MKLPVQITKTVSRQILVLQKHSPRILFVGGVGGVITSTVLACKATLKLPDVLDKVETSLEVVRVNSDNDKVDRKQVASVYGRAVYDVSKLYAPAVALGTLSIGALTGSHVTLTRRNAGLTAAYAAVSNSFDEYRARVRNEIGEDRERDIKNAIVVQDGLDEKGKKTKLATADPSKWSPYARFFDECSPNWQKNAETNRIFLQAQQNYANHLLRARGHVFLNEVYDMLGLERIQAGQVVGWVLDENGDNFIDFGMFEAHNSRFLNGWERSIILDFNVDGVIYDKI